QELGEQVEARRLAGTIGPDQCVNRVAAHSQVDRLDCDESAKVLGEPLGLEGVVGGHRWRPRRSIRTCAVALELVLARHLAGALQGCRTQPRSRRPTVPSFEVGNKAGAEVSTSIR